MNKCSFLEKSVEYLGHCIDATGLHTTTKKVEAVQLAPTPKDQNQLRSFLRLLHYYGKFMPNLASLLHPLNTLLQSGVKWSWSADCEKVFQKAKELLMTTPVLAHYDPLQLAGDASAYGMGAVISHLYPDGSERPVAYASRTFTKSEKNYAQLEKEACSLVFGSRKFHQYMYGRKFTLYTDHKPLTTILGPKKGIPPLAAARLQRWAIILSAYDYETVFKPTKSHANADGLSRLPVSTRVTAQEPDGVSIFNISQVHTLPIMSSQLRRATRQDPDLGSVLRYTRNGWPEKVPPELQPYWSRRHEITVEGECLIWGIRVIVPEKLRGRVLDELHQSHMGIAKTKALSRRWPHLDAQIEQLTKCDLSGSKERTNGSTPTSMDLAC